MRQKLLVFSVVLILFSVVTGIDVWAEDQNLSDTVSCEEYGAIDYNFLYDNGDGTKTLVSAPSLEHSDVTNNLKIVVYDEGDNAISEKNIAYELHSFQSFYHGSQYNYVVYAQQNQEEDDTKEVIRIIKYDKDFNRIDSVSVFGDDAYAIISLGGRMCEYNGELVYHGCRTRYMTSDLKNHQSNFTIVIDSGTMKIKNILGSSQANQVGHSFDQYVQFDGDDHVLLDLGDAYPRAVVLHKETDSNYYNEESIFNISGYLGQNYTGVDLQGFEVSSDHYLVMLSSIDQANFDYVQNASNLIERQKDITLFAVEKDISGSQTAVRKVSIAKFIATDKFSSKARLVKVSDSQFMVMWQERPNNYTDGTSQLKYVLVDNEGTIKSQVYTEKVPERTYEIPGVDYIGQIKKTISTPEILAKCQPVVIDDEIVICYDWVFNNNIPTVAWLKIPIVNQEKVNMITDKITSLPKISELTLGDKSDVEDAKKAYESLAQLGKDAFSDDIVSKLNSAVVRIAELSSSGDCIYQTHIENIGWQDWKEDGQISGTVGESKRLEGIRISTTNVEGDVGVSYSTHIQNVGWQDYASNGEMSGTEGLGLRLEAIKIKLTGSDADKYDVYYRVHAQNVGWMGWASNGDDAGTAGYGYRLECIEIRIIEKGAAAPGPTNNAFVKK